MLLAIGLGIFFSMFSVLACYPTPVELYTTDFSFEWKISLTACL